VLGGIVAEPHRQKRCILLAAEISSHKQIVLPADGDETQRPFGRVIVDLQQPVVQVACQFSRNLNRGTGYEEEPVHGRTDHPDFSDMDRPDKVRHRCSRNRSGQSTLELFRAAAFNGVAATRSIKSSYSHQISTRFNKSFNLVRDQGVGGSNLLSPTNKVDNLQTREPNPLVLAQMCQRRRVRQRQYWVSRRALDAKPRTKTSTAGSDDPVLHPDSETGYAARLVDSIADCP
jgi:hypothetical protein